MDIKGRHRQILLIWTILLCLGVATDVALGATEQGAIQKYSQEAEQALARKDLAGAAAALEKLAGLTPDVAEAHANLGMVYYSQGRMMEATKAFQRALELNPKISNVGLMLGICYAEIGRHREAVPILEPAFQKPPDHTIGRLIGLELQRAYIGLRQYDKASIVADELLSQYPNDPEVIYHAARLHGDRALQLMIRLADVAPNSVWMLQARAEVHESQKHYDLAVKEYRRLLEKDPRLPGVHFRLGRALWLGSEDEETRNEALQAFQEELGIDPLNSDAWYEIGEINRQRGQLEQALQHFRKAVEHHPEFEDAQIALARTLINLKSPKEALPPLLAAIRLNPTNEVSHFQLANVYKALGEMSNYQEELALFEKYHARPYASGTGSSQQLPVILTAPQVTKQTLDSETPQP